MKRALQESMKYTLIAMIINLSCQAQSLKWSFDGKPIANGIGIKSCEEIELKRVSGVKGFGFNTTENSLCRLTTSNSAAQSNFTISALIYPTAYPEKVIGNVIVSACSSAEPKRLIHSLRMNKNKLEFVVWNQRTGGEFKYSGVTSRSIIPLNEWTHVTVVRDDERLHLFINGVLDRTQGSEGFIKSGVDTFLLGSDLNLDLKDRFFSGVIDEVSVSFSDLSEKQVAYSYVDYSKNSTDIVDLDGELYYPLELSDCSLDFPISPVRINLNLQFLRAILEERQEIKAEDLYVVGWDSTEGRPLKEDIPYRVFGNDLYTKKVSVGFKRLAGIKNYALCLSSRKDQSEIRKIPLIGVGEPISVGSTDLTAELGQGLAGYPVVVDYDNDGDKDLLVSFVIPRRIFLYENMANNNIGEPKLSAPKMIFGGSSLRTFDIHQATDGTIYAYSASRKPNHIDRWVCQKNGDAETLDFRGNVSIAGLPEECSIFHIAFQDSDGDGVKDLLLGVQEGSWWWPDGIDPWNSGKGNPKVGFGKGYSSKNKWMGPPPISSVYLAKNTGSNLEPEFGVSQVILVQGQPLSMPSTQISPCLVDMNNDGGLDLLLACGVDKLLVYYNEKTDGKNLKFKYPENALLEDSVTKWSYFDLRFEVCDWDNDGQNEVIICSNPGITEKCEIVDGKLVEEKILHCYGGNVWADSLVVPTMLDYNHDGSMDVVMGDASGYLNFFPNTHTTATPLFPVRKRLKSNGVEFRQTAGYSGSIQGPSEARWGYLAPIVCDWNGDGKYDVITSGTDGYIYWLANQSKDKKDYDLSSSVKLEIDRWPLKVRWRTRPAIFYNEENGLPYIITSDSEGFLTMYKRDLIQGPAALSAGQRLKFATGAEIKIDSISGYNGRNKLFGTDWNNDGKIDLLIGQPRRDKILAEKRFDLVRADRATVLVLLNVGSNLMPVFENPERLNMADGGQLEYGNHSCAPAVYDYDDDGHDDLFVGAETGFIHCYNRSLFEDESQIISIPFSLKRIGR